MSINTAWVDETIAELSKLEDDFLKCDGRDVVYRPVLIAQLQKARHTEAAFPGVRGRCPACGRHGLFLADGGYMTCGNGNCVDPTFVADLLEPQGTVPPSPHERDRNMIERVVNLMKHRSFVTGRDGSTR